MADSLPACSPTWITTAPCRTNPATSLCFKTTNGTDYHISRTDNNSRVGIARLTAYYLNYDGTYAFRL